MKTYTFLKDKQNNKWYSFKKFDFLNKTKNMTKKKRIEGVIYFIFQGKEAIESLRIRSILYELWSESQLVPAMQNVYGAHGSPHPSSSGL